MSSLVSIAIGLLAGVALISGAIYVAVRPYLAVHVRPLMPDNKGGFDSFDMGAPGCGGDSGGSGCGGFGDGACH